MPGASSSRRQFMPATAAILLEVGRLLDGESLRRARAVGQAFRLAYTLTGGAPGLIHDTSLALENGRVVLAIPEHTAIYTGEAVQRRLEALGRTMGSQTALKTNSPQPSKRKRA